MMGLKKGDDIFIIAGKSKGKRGTILSVIRKKGKVLVEGINIMKKHIKANPNKNIQGGIVEKEAPIDISNVALYNSVTKKADRFGVKSIENNGKKVRYFKSNDELVDI